MRNQGGNSKTKHKPLAELRMGFRSVMVTVSRSGERGDRSSGGAVRVADIYPSIPTGRVCGLFVPRGVLGFANTLLGCHVYTTTVPLEVWFLFASIFLDGSSKQRNGHL